MLKSHKVVKTIIHSFERRLCAFFENLMRHRFSPHDRVLLHNINFPAFTLFTAKDQPAQILCEDSEKDLLICLQQNSVRFDPDCVVLVLCTCAGNDGAKLMCDFNEAVVFQMRKPNPVGAHSAHAQAAAAPADFLP